MDEKILIAKRVALELRDRTLVNLGIGLPTLVASFLPEDIEVFFQSENGIVGMLALLEDGLELDDLTDAGGNPIGALPGAARQRNVLWAHSRRSCGPHRTGRPSGGSVRPIGELDGAGQQRTGHGRRNGSRLGSKASHRCHDTYGQW
jgi:hypothetical protein